MIQVQGTTFTRQQEITSTTLHLVDKRQRDSTKLQAQDNRIMLCQQLLFMRDLKKRFIVSYYLP